MSESKKCPNCRLINPEDALLCDCGYNFNLNKEDQNSSIFIENYAGLFSRLIAYFIDIIPIIVLVVLFFLIFTDINEVFTNFFDNPRDIQARKDFLYNRNKIRDISLIIWIVYSIIFESLPLQGTLGKVLLGIKVSNIDGSKISVGKSIIRNIFKLVSTLIILIGIIVAAISKKKQFLHDIIAKTVVIKK